jgi:type II secretory pathway pseudopilin PulG
MLTTLLNVLILFGILAIASALVLFPLVAVQKRQQKHKALRDYVRRVGRVLRVRYGKQPSYAPNSVKQMLREWGYSTNFDCYCLALYCNQIEFDSYHQSTGQACDYLSMRQEICIYLPFAEDSFSAADVIDLGDRINTHNSRDSSDLFEDTSDFITSDYGDSSYSGGDSGGGDYGGGDSGGGGSD